MSADEIAARFAAALDADDFDAFRALLAPDCRYEVRGAALVGPDAILDSYRYASEAAHSEFDEVTYASRVLRVDGDSAVIEFADHLEREGAVHVFLCLQHLTVAAGVITVIRHEDLPGEREKLSAFRAGLT
jgi:hypothetical protein